MTFTLPKSSFPSFSWEAHLRTVLPQLLHCCCSSADLQTCTASVKTRCFSGLPALQAADLPKTQSRCFQHWGKKDGWGGRAKLTSLLPRTLWTSQDKWLLFQSLPSRHPSPDELWVHSLSNLERLTFRKLDLFRGSRVAYLPGVATAQNATQAT